MIPSPIRKVLSTIRKHQVRYLLMGGQACVLYGAAQFSRDIDLAIQCESDAIGKLSAALDELDAVEIAIPPFAASYLKRGHAVHFRCGHPDAVNVRVDVMAVQRGVAPFEELWPRRTTLTTGDSDTIDVMALPDLVQAKKTQRDKDWPMVRGLVEVDYLANRVAATEDQVRFWFRELRTPSLLLEAAQRFPDILTSVASNRPVLSAVAAGAGEETLEMLLQEEQNIERRLDREYWQPLKTELEALRHGKKNT